MSYDNDSDDMLSIFDQQFDWDGDGKLDSFETFMKLDYITVDDSEKDDDSSYRSRRNTSYSSSSCSYYSGARRHEKTREELLREERERVERIRKQKEQTMQDWCQAGVLFFLSFLLFLTMYLMEKVSSLVGILLAIPVIVYAIYYITVNDLWDNH